MSQRDKPPQGVVASSLDLVCDGADGSIVWLMLDSANSPVLLPKRARVQSG